MKTRIAIPLLLVSLALLVSAAVATQAQEGISVRGETGSSQRSGSAPFGLTGSVGQPAAGRASGGGFTVQGGFLSVLLAAGTPTATATPTATPSLTPTPIATESATPTATATETATVTPTPTATESATPTETTTVTPTATETPTPTATVEATTATPTATPSATPTPTPTPTATVDPIAMIRLGGNEALGPFLTAADGMTLYYTRDDLGGISMCYDVCAEYWLPFAVPEGFVPTLGEGLTGEVSTFRRDDGLFQARYNNLPLYFWVEDTAPGMTTGHGLGGVWFVVPP